MWEIKRIIDNGLPDDSGSCSGTVLIFLPREQNIKENWRKD